MLAIPHVEDMTLVIILER